MKRSRLIAALLCLSLGSFANAGPYQVVTEEWAPYNYLEGVQLTGMTTEIVRAIMNLTGDDFEVTLLPSMRASLILQTRSKTIMYSMFRTPERERLYKWVGPIAEESIHAWQRADTPALNTLEQLMQTAHITTRHAGLLPDTLQARGFTNLDRSATENRQLYLMLLAGRTDVIAGDTDVGVAYYSRQTGMPAGMLRQIPVELYRSQLFIAFSLDSEDTVVAAWSRALEQLRESGELERIKARYLLPTGR